MTFPGAPKYGTRGVMCLEGPWHDDLHRRGTVRPMLEMLESVGACSHIHRDVNTTEEARNLLRKWSQAKYSHWSVLYLASHGSKGQISFGREDVTLDELGEWLEGRCTGRVVYFGACAVMRDSNAVAAFARRTKASHVLGYTTNIDWIDAAAFEVALLGALGKFRRTGDALNYVMHKGPASLADDLGFVRYPEPATRQ